jgi:hypothetical protein
VALDARIVRSCMHASGAKLASELTSYSSTEAVMQWLMQAGANTVDKWREAGRLQKAPSEWVAWIPTIMKPVSGHGEGGSCAPKHQKLCRCCICARMAGRLWSFQSAATSGKTKFAGRWPLGRWVLVMLVVLDMACS